MISPEEQASESCVFFKVVRSCNDIAIGYKVKPIRCNLIWNSRLTTTIGRAIVDFKSTRSGTVELSSKLWTRADHQTTLHIMYHELAHIFAELEQEKANHGPVWKKWMDRFAQPSDVTIMIEAIND